ncbi:unnamed protein product, partial [Closterium sp. Yama58-4]
MVDQVRMLQHIHSCAHAEDEVAGGDAGGIMRATAGGMKPRVLKASTPIRDIYKSEGPIDEDVVCMQADWPLTWTHITLATGVSVGSGIAGPEDVTMLTQATTCTAILCLQGEESLESFGVNWKAVQEQAEQCDVAMFRVPVPEFDQQKQVAGMVEAVRLLASLLVTGHRVHVACATGKNCSPLVVLGYLTFFQGLAWSEAKAMIVDSVPSADPSHEAWEQARLVLSAADGVGAHRMTELAEEQYQRRIEQGAGAEGGGQTARDDWEEAQRRLITETLQHRVSADVTISQSLSKAASRQASSPKPREVQQSFPPVVDAQIAPPLDAPFQQQPHILDSVYSFVNDHHAHAWPTSAPPPADASPASEGTGFSGEGVLGEGVLDGEGGLGEVSSGVEERIALLEQKHLAAMAAARSATEQVRFFMQHVCELRESETAARMEAAAAHERIALLTAQVEALNLFQQQQQLQQQQEEMQQREKEQQEQKEQQASAFLGVDSAAAAAAAAASAEATAAAVAAATAEAEAAAAAAAERESALHSQLSEVSQELSLLQERERELLSAHEAAEAKAQAAEERAAELANRIAQMEEMEAAAKEAAAVALERMQALAEQVKELSEKERAAAARMGEMETRLEEASEKAAADHDRMVKLEDRAERAEKEARKAQEALGAANERVKFFFRVMRGLRDRERAAKEAMHAATDRLEAAVTEAENLRRKDELMREAWAVASERIELLTRQVQQVEGLKMEVKREAVDAAKVFLHESDEHRLMVAREELSAAEERERMLQAQLERLGAELAAARDDMAERDARLAAVAAEVAERERVVEESRAVIGAAEKRIKELEEQVGVAEERERKAKREAEEAEATLAAALATAKSKDREYTLMETSQQASSATAAGAGTAVAAAVAAGVSSASGAAASSAADQLIGRLQSQVAAMSSELAGARNAAAAASERSAFLMRQVARLKGTAAADAVTRSQGGSGGGKGEGSGSKHKVAALEVEIRALEKRERAARAEAEAEKARVRELEAQVGQLESKERAARVKLQSSQDRVGFFLRQAVELREREGASKSALKETFKKVEGLSHQVGLLQGELARASKESGKSTDTVERLQQLTLELKERIHETSRVASSIKKGPGSPRVNGFERNGAWLGLQYSHAVRTLLSINAPRDALWLAVLLLVTASAFCPVILPAASAPVCNLFEGRWVVDGNRPPYQDSCPFLFNLTRCSTNGRPDDAYVRYSCHFGQLIKGKQIAIIGDSLTSANFVPSLLCQINQQYWVSPKPELRTLDGGAWSKDSPEAVAYVYSIPDLNAKIVMLWDDYLVRINENATMLAKVGGITDPRSEDCLIDVMTPNPQWARYLDEWDAVLLETTTHWRALSNGPRMVYTNENWGKMSLDQYQAHSQALTSVRTLFENRKKMGKVLPLPFFMTAPPQHNAKKVGGKGVCGSPGRLLNAKEMGKLQRTNVQMKLFLPIQKRVFTPSYTVRRMDITSMSAARPEAHIGGFMGG